MGKVDNGAIDPEVIKNDYNKNVYDPKDNINKITPINSKNNSTLISAIKNKNNDSYQDDKSINNNLDLKHKLDDSLLYEAHLLKPEDINKAIYNVVNKSLVRVDSKSN